MIAPTTMYWLTRLDGIHDFSILLTIILLLGTAICFPLGNILAGAKKDYFTTEEEAARYRKIGKRLLSCAKWCVAAWIVSVSALLFLPTTKEMAAILVVPKVANSEKVQEIGGRLYDLAVEWMEELRPTKGKGGDL